MKKEIQFAGIAHGDPHPFNVSPLKVAHLASRVRGHKGNVVIVGPQGCGKSVLMAQILKDSDRPIVEEWDWKTELPPSAVALTNDDNPERILPGVIVVRWEAPEAVFTPSA